MSRPRATAPTYTLVNRKGYYYVQWWQQGQSLRVSCRTTDHGQAKEFLASFKAGRESPPPPASPLIREVLEGYLKDREGKVFSHSIYYIIDTLKSHLGDLPCDMLRGEQVIGYWNIRRREGARGVTNRYRRHKRPLSDGTLVRELGVLRSALTWAYRKKWIIEIPFVERPSAPYARTRWLTHEELERLLTHVRQQHTRLFILIALYTGARSGAILELTWDRVDLETRRIDFGAGRGLKRRSIVPINDELFDVMVNAFDAANCKWVISHGARRLASIRHGFRMAVADAQLKDVTPHVLRHTAASWMLQAGVPIEEVAAYLGNSKEIVRRVYGHHSPTYLQGASQALSRQRGLDNQSSMNQKNARVS